MSVVLANVRPVTIPDVSLPKAGSASTHAPIAPFASLGRTVLLVDDIDLALAFYRDVLGFAILHDEETDGFRYLHIGLPGQQPAGLWLMPATTERDRRMVGRQSGDQPLLVLYTDHFDHARERLVAHGSSVWDERDDPGSRSLHFRDPLGNVIVAVQLKAQAP
ncbi:MAG: Glyoxalase-like domain protein [Sphaerisporangium sp.]|jgi:predicted enzyme related to lactoylglutathione lyase|nr:Glyoxalase-like domain protein [Sphaerisporangium sp.]